MAYGDKISFGDIKTSNIYYEKDNTSFFTPRLVKAEIISQSGWYYYMEFKTRKEWFKFVKEINKLNKEFKKLPNIERN